MSEAYDPRGIGAGRRLRMSLVPSGSVIVASAITTLPIISAAPMMPPFGFMMLIAWRMMRSTIWPVWIGIPLGLFDDIVSGQPVGSACALWTLVMLAMDALDRRVVWRDYWIDWIISAVALLFVLVGGAVLAHAGSAGDIARLTMPQWVWSLLLMPMAMLVAGRLDSWRIQR